MEKAVSVVSRSRVGGDLQSCELDAAEIEKHKQ